MPNGSRYSLLGRFPLRWQLSLPVLISIVLLGVTYTHYWASRYAEQRRTTFVESGQRAVQILTPQLSELMRAGDVSGIEATLRRFANWDYLAHAKVYGEQGRVAAYNLQDNVSEAFREHLTQHRVHHNHVFEIDGLTVFMGDLTGRNGDTIGHLAVAFDQAQVEAGIFEARQEALSIGVVGFLVISGLVFVLSMSITRPLSRATRMIDRVAQGDLNFVTSDTERRDEVGRIARAVEVFRRNAADLIKAQAEATASRKVAQMALVDPLTNIPNRRALEEHLGGIRAEASAEDTHLYVLHIDLDGFKQINDTLGHAAGDRVLQAISERLVACLPPGGFAARVGGDEFVVTLAASEGSSLPEDVTMRIIDAARQDVEFEDQKMRVSCSVGVAAACIQLGQFAEALVHADIALYRAKADGKNRYALFSQKHRQDVLDRKNLAEDLFRGLEAGEFEPYFQPQVRGGDHKIIGCEVLARWHHPTRGVLLPADFIQVAEDIGVLRHIDRMIFQKASVHYAAWREAGVALPSLSFNISVQRLFEKDLRDGIEEMCKAGIKVNIELVESTYLDELADNVMWILVELRSLGAGIEIDDFGTGHSSVAGLLRVNPDRIKIDRQFVIPMETSERERQLVGLFVQIARTLNMEIVAEGVETLDHARSLAELGCDTLQGFAFGGAMPAEAFLAELTRPEGLRATG